MAGRRISEGTRSIPEETALALTGCGLCGIDSIAQAMRPTAVISKWRSFNPREIMAAMASLPPLQPINVETSAVHAAAFWTPAAGIVALREDVGRHNALDKLAGALVQVKTPASGVWYCYQPCFGRDGSEDGGDRRRRRGRRLRADGARRQDGGRRRHCACRRRPVRRL